MHVSMMPLLADVGIQNTRYDDDRGDDEADRPAGGAARLDG